MARRLALLLAAALVGRFAFASPVLLALLLLLPALWTADRWRGWPAAVMFAYYLGVNADLVPTLAAFLPAAGGSFPGAEFVYPVLLAAILATPFLVLNPIAEPRYRMLQALIALLILTVPPIGLLSWQNPLFAAAVVGPRFGWFGVLIAAAFFAALTCRPWERAAPAAGKRLTALAAIPALVALAFDVARPLPEQAPRDLVGVTMTIGNPAEHSPLDRAQQVFNAAYPHVVEGVRLVALPEAVLAHTPASEMALNQLHLDAERAGVVVLIGATVAGADGRSWRNAILALGAADRGIVQESRLPAPVGNWQTGGGAPLRPIATDTLDVAGLRVAVSICYEDLMIWPHFGLFAARTDVLVSIGNRWMAQGLMANYQETGRWALARIGGVPLVAATNTAP